MRDKLIKIKRSRLKPEELFLIDILNEIEIVFKNDYFIFWGIDDEILFLEKLEEGWLSCNRIRIWIIIESLIRKSLNLDNHVMCYDITRNLIIEISKSYKDWEELTPLFIEEKSLKKLYEDEKTKNNK